MFPEIDSNKTTLVDIFPRTIYSVEQVNLLTELIARQTFSYDELLKYRFSQYYPEQSTSINDFSYTGVADISRFVDDTFSDLKKNGIMDMAIVGSVLAGIGEAYPYGVYTTRFENGIE